MQIHVDHQYIVSTASYLFDMAAACSNPLYTATRSLHDLLARSADTKKRYLK